MTQPDPTAHTASGHCEVCGTALQTHDAGQVLNPDAESMVTAHAVTPVADFCPNPDCPRGGVDVEPTAQL